MARSLSGFIRYAEKVGMPVRLLKFVRDNGYAFRSTKGDISYTDPDSNTIYWNELVRDTIASATVGPDKNGELTYDNKGVNELYHEASHAYIEMRSGPRGGESFLGGLFNDDNYREKRLESQHVKSVMARAERHYKGAPLEGHILPVLDEERAAYEAIAMYVGHRAGWMWQALDRLTFLDQRVPRDASLAQKALMKVSRLGIEYERAMMARTFGYDELGAGRFRKQYLVQKDIPGKLRKLCDEVMLEGKVPDRFDQSEALAKLRLSVIAKALVQNGARAMESALGEHAR